MKKVLLTGASGFIGSHCLSFLKKKGYEVFALYRTRYLEEPKGIQWVQADLLNSGQVKHTVQTIRPTHLLHLAWDVTPGKCLTSSENLDWIKAGLTLMEAFSNSSGRRLVMAGTCYEYDLTNGFVSEEITPLKPHTLYGGAKLSLNIALESFAKQMGLSAAWGRIFFLYGPNECSQRFVPSVIKGLLKKQTVPCTHCNQIRDYMYVEDVAEAMVELLDSSIEGSINIASGKGISLRTIIENIEDQLQVKGLVQYGALKANASEPSQLIGSKKRLNDELKWQPRWNLREGVAKTIEWWQ